VVPFLQVSGRTDALRALPKQVVRDVQVDYKTPSHRRWKHFGKWKSNSKGERRRGGHSLISDNLGEIRKRFRGNVGMMEVVDRIKAIGDRLRKNYNEGRGTWT